MTPGPPATIADALQSELLPACCAGLIWAFAGALASAARAFPMVPGQDCVVAPPRSLVIPRQEGLHGSRARCSASQGRVAEPTALRRRAEHALPLGNCIVRREVFGNLLRRIVSQKEEGAVGARAARFLWPIRVRLRPLVHQTTPRAKVFP